jgi:hypothetical protein
MSPRAIPDVLEKKNIYSPCLKSKLVLPVANAVYRLRYSRQIFSIFVCRSANFFINYVLRHVRERCPTLILNLFYARSWLAVNGTARGWNALSGMRALLRLFFMNPIMFRHRHVTRAFAVFAVQLAGDRFNTSAYSPDGNLRGLGPKLERRGQRELTSLFTSGSPHISFSECCSFIPLFVVDVNLWKMCVHACYLEEILYVSCVV